MANQNVTVTVDRSQILDAIRVLQQLIGYEQQASQNINVRVNTSELDRANSSAQQFASTLRDISTIMNTIGDGFGALGNFSSGIANAFSGMSQMMGNQNIANAITRFITYNALRGVRSQIGNITSRYDIMSTFIPYMQVAGADEQTATTALARVNESILGLPIGLDESAQRLRRYQMFLGDLESATNLTIGAQNAILAGGASDQMRNMAYLQIDRLLSAGRLNTSRQWLSLIQGLGVSMRFVSEQMGVAGMDVRDLAAGLTSGAIDARTFLDALMALGEGSSEAAQGLAETLNIYKGTLEAWLNNINFAIVRGGQNVLDALNATLIGETGQGLTGYMKNYRDFLNTAFKGISNWITDNPQALRDVLGDAYQLIDGLQRFSASAVGSGVLDGLGRTFSMVSTALSSIPEGKLEEFVSFATTIAGPASQIMQMSSSLGILAGVFERFKDFDFDMLVGDIADEIGRMAGIIERVLNLVGDERMSQLLAIGLVWGRPVQSVLGAGASLLSTAAMTRLAFGGLTNGPIGTAVGAGLSSATAAMGGFMLTPWGLALAGTAAAGAGTAALLNWRQGQRESAILQAYGLNNAAGGTNMRTGIVNELLTAAHASYTGVSNLPLYSRDAARNAANTISTNIRDLNAEYQNQVAMLMAFEAGREAIQARYDEIDSRMYWRDENGNITGRKYNQISYDDQQFYYGAERALKDVDGAIAQTKENMAALNGEMVKQGTEAGRITLKFGDLEVVLKSTAEAYEETEAPISAYEEHLRDLTQTYQEVRNAALQSFQQQLTGFDVLEAVETPEGGFLKEDTEGLTSQNELAESVITNLDLIKEYIDGLSNSDTTGVSLAGFVHDILGSGDLEEVAPQLQAIVDQLGGENGIGAQLKDALEAFDINEDVTSRLSTALANFGASVDEHLGSVGEAATAFNNLKAAVEEIPGAWEESFTSMSSGLAEFASSGVSSAVEAADGVGSAFTDMAKKSEDGSQRTTKAAEETTTGIKNQVQPVTSASSAFGEGGAAGFAALASAAQSAAGATAAAVAQIIANLQAAQSAVNGAMLMSAAPTTEVAAAQEYVGGSATGGPINWKPFGSDTVPRMLTPGEYIIRKGAADFFGRGLLERINALDIGGAFDRLILNSPVTAGRFGGNVYNKDSHASVSQTFYNSSPDYGRRRAMRFATAL